MTWPGVEDVLRPWTHPGVTMLLSPRLRKAEMPRGETRPHKDTKSGSLVRPGLAGSHTAYLHAAGVPTPRKVRGAAGQGPGVGFQVSDGRILAETGGKVLIR